jgi:branched-chain amino acid transport system substrate-binding protein
LNKKIFLFAALLIAMLFVLSLAGCSPATPGEEDVTPPEDETPEVEAPVFDNEIKIAVTGPMTNIQGEMMWWGAQMAAEEINAAGGVMVGEEAYGISLIQVDTDEKSDPLGAVSAVENVILSEDPDFLMGGFRTEGVMAYTELAVVDYQKIFLICGAATNELTKGRVDEDYDTWKYIFRVTPVNATDLAMVTVQMVTQVANAVREELGIDTPKIAILAEKLQWNETLVQLAPQIFPTLGLEFVGTFQPSATATDVTTELRGIEASGAHIIYTIMSDSVGIPFGKQWGELEIPACPVGINVEAQKEGYYAATDGFGDYDYTLSMIAQNAAINEFTIPFIEKFRQKFGQLPMYNSDTYTALYIIKEAVERAASLDTDAVVVELEKTDHTSAAGRFVFDELHDVVWAPGYITAVGIQWQDGELLGTWPIDWKPDPTNPDLVVGFEGMLPYKIPPHVLEQWRQ